MNEEMKKTREAAKITKKEMAAYAEVTPMSYHRYERNEREPGVRTAIRIADALNIPVSDEFRNLWFNNNPG